MSFPQQIRIGDRLVGRGCPVFVVAEAGVAHFGSEEKAYRLVDLASAAGADAVKFQVFSVEALISRELPEWRTRLGSRQLPFEAFERIQAYSRRRGIMFFATAHDEPSLEFLASLDVPVFKIGSGEVGNWPFLQRVASFGKPVILSTGMYRPSQIQEALDAITSAGNRDLAILHCVTRYPTPPSEVRLRGMTEIAERFQAVTGYSDHTAGFHVPLAAVALGAQIIEKHITLDFNVPDAQDWKVSCGPADLAIFISQVRDIEAALAAAAAEPGEAERANLVWASKSLVAARDLAPGTTIAPGDLTSKRPGTGISPARVSEIIGRIVAVPVPCDTVLRWEHLQ